MRRQHEADGNETTKIQGNENAVQQPAPARSECPSLTVSFHPTYAMRSCELVYGNAKLTRGLGSPTESAPAGPAEAAKREWGQGSTRQSRSKPAMIPGLGVSNL